MTATAAKNLKHLLGDQKFNCHLYTSATLPEALGEKISDCRSLTCTAIQAFATDGKIMPVIANRSFHTNAYDSLMTLIAKTDCPVILAHGSMLGERGFDEESLCKLPGWEQELVSTGPNVESRQQEVLRTMGQTARWAMQIEASLKKMEESVFVDTIKQRIAASLNEREHSDVGDLPQITAEVAAWLSDCYNPDHYNGRNSKFARERRWKPLIDGTGNLTNSSLADYAGAGMYRPTSEEHFFLPYKPDKPTGGEQYSHSFLLNPNSSEFIAVGGDEAEFLGRYALTKASLEDYSAEHRGKSNVDRGSIWNKKLAEKCLVWRSIIQKTCDQVLSLPKEAFTDETIEDSDYIRLRNVFSGMKEAASRGTMAKVVDEFLA